MTNTSSWTAVPFRTRQAIRQTIAGTLPAACVICGRTIELGTAFHVEHVEAVNRGGPMLDFANIGPAHPGCNLGKGDRVLDTAAYVAPWTEHVRT